MLCRIPGGPWRVLWLLFLMPGLLIARPSAELVSLLPVAMPKPPAVQRLSKDLRATVTLLEPEAALLEAVRHAAPSPSRTACEEGAPALMASIQQAKRVPAPAEASGLYQALLEQAAQQILYVDFQGALKTLKDARAALPCATGILTHAQVRALFLHEAVSHVFLKDGKHTEAFLAMLAVDGRVYLEQDYPPRVQTAFLDAARQFIKIQPRGINVPSGSWEVRLDGDLVTPQTQTRPGWHVVQVGAEGEPQRTALFEVAAGDEAIKLLEVPELGLLSAAEAKQRLVEGLRIGKLGSELTAGLERYLKRRGISVLGFAVEEEGKARAVAYEVGVGVVAPARLLGLATKPRAEAVVSTDTREPRRAPEGSLEDPGAAGLGLGAEARLGGGASLVPGSATVPAGFVEVRVSKEVGPLALGLSGKLRLETAEGVPLYPALGFGLSAAWGVKLADHLELFPALGYQVGKGPAAQVACLPNTDTTLSLTCVPAGQGAEGDWAAVAATRGHGPLARVEAVYSRVAGTLRWSASGGIQASYQLFSSYLGGEMTMGESLVPYSVSDDISAPHSLRLDVTLGGALTF